VSLSMTHEITDELVSLLADMLHPVSSIPEWQRPAVYRGMQRLARSGLENPDLSFDVHRAAGLWMGLADRTWAKPEPVTDELLFRQLADVLRPILSIAEVDRAACYRGLQRLEEDGCSTKQSFDVPSIATVATRAARQTWPAWPPEEEG
jgi:hypothetical protein